MGDLRDDLRRIWGWLRPGAAERRLDEEIRFHLEREAEEYERAGMTPEEARREALKQFGGVDRYAEASRDIRPTRWLEDLGRDVRVGGRALVRHPAYGSVAIAALVIGIGSSTFVYSAVRGVLMEPLPYPHADRIVTLWETNATTGEDHLQTSPGNVIDWRARNQSFEIIALAEPSGGDIVVDGRPIAIPSWAVSEGYFEVFGIRPALGRTFTPEEYRDSLRSALMISYASWQRRFAGDPGIVGRSIEVDRVPRTVVGVLSEGFAYPAGAPGDGGLSEPAKEFWEPRADQPWDARTRSGNWMPAVGLLREGVELGRAQADLDRVASQLAEENPSTNANLGVRAIPLLDEVLGEARILLSILAGVVAVLLLLAAANVASLILARATAREREFAIRGAVGAGRGRLVRQILAESALLVALGAALGLALAWAAVQLFAAVAAEALPRAANIRVDARVALFALGVSALVTVCAGLLPALRFARPDLGRPMRDGARGSTGGPPSARAQNALVVAQVALALVLLIGGGLLGRSFMRLLDNDLGFEPAGLATVQAFIYDITDGPAQRVAFVRDATERMRGLPGVRGAAMVSAFPFHPEQIDQRFNFTVVGRPAPAGTEPPSAQSTTVSPGYFYMMEIPLIEGRYFSEFDRADWAAGGDGSRTSIGGVGSSDETIGGLPVAIVSQAVARRHWPGESAVGQRFQGVREGSPEVEIVGVVGDIRPYGYDTDPRPEIYFPHGWNGSGAITFVARAETPRGAPGLVDAMRETVWSLAPNQSIYHAGTSEQMIASSLAARRFNLALILGFAGIALVLALIGVYGLMAYASARRTGEFGIRMALGAERADIVRLVLGRAAALTAAGAAVGVAVALGVTRFAASLLYGVPPNDPMTFAALALLLIGTGVLAGYLPARRAAATNPMEALRAE
ncbi:MAG TPA: ABC transporter permease [Longimicrobiales bacterium]|nr:ABC transporter permease [Longimicrobiales bacterium]